VCDTLMRLVTGETGELNNFKDLVSKSRRNIGEGMAGKKKKRTGVGSPGKSIPT